MPAWAFGETLVVISVVGGSTFGLTERARVSGVGADESDNSNVSLKAPVCVGVPDNALAPVFNFTPGSRDPDTRHH